MPANRTASHNGRIIGGEKGLAQDGRSFLLESTPRPLVTLQAIPVTGATYRSLTNLRVYRITENDLYIVTTTLNSSQLMIYDKMTQSWYIVENTVGVVYTSAALIGNSLVVVQRIPNGELIRFDIIKDSSVTPATISLSGISSETLTNDTNDSYIIQVADAPSERLLLVGNFDLESQRVSLVDATWDDGASQWNLSIAVARETLRSQIRHATFGAEFISRCHLITAGKKLIISSTLRDL